MKVGDVYTPEGRSRNRVRLRPEIAKGGRSGDVFLPDATLARVLRLWRHKATRREGQRRQDPLFRSQSRTRISPRRVQFTFRTWQVKTGFDRLHPLYALIHTAITNVYRVSRDLFLAQRFARHVSPPTTTVYTHPSDRTCGGYPRPPMLKGRSRPELAFPCVSPSDEELFSSIQRLSC